MEIEFDFASRIDRYLELSDKVAEISAAAAAKTKPLTEEIGKIAEELQAAMNGQNLRIAGGKKVKDGKRGVAEITDVVKINITDYEALESFVIRKKCPHLFERRISGPAFREMKEQLGNKPIPGLTEVTLASFKVKRAK